MGDKVAMTGDDFLLEFGVHFGRKTTMRATATRTSKGVQLGGGIPSVGWFKQILATSP